MNRYYGVYCIAGCRQIQPVGKIARCEDYQEECTLRGCAPVQCLLGQLVKIARGYGSINLGSSDPQMVSPLKALGCRLHRTKPSKLFRCIVNRPAVCLGGNTPSVLLATFSIIIQRFAQCY